MLHLILAESALELIPKEIASHPQVKMDCERRRKKYDELLLDSSLHFGAMRELKERRKRGRPDILHLCLLVAQDSIASKAGELRLYIHTQQSEIIYVNPETRLPRNYDRFKGLMVSLFKKRKIKNLLRMEDKGINDLLGEISPDEIFVMEKNGERIGKLQFIERMKELGNPCFIVGGFPYGNLSSSIPGKRISLSDKTLEAQTVVSTIIFCYELARGL